MRTVRPCVSYNQHCRRCGFRALEISVSTGGKTCPKVGAEKAGAVTGPARLGIRQVAVAVTRRQVAGRSSLRLTGLVRLSGEGQPGPAPVFHGMHHISGRPCRGHIGYQVRIVRRVSLRVRR